MATNEESIGKTFVDDVLQELETSYMHLEMKKCLQVSLIKELITF